MTASKGPPPARGAALAIKVGFAAVLLPAGAFLIGLLLSVLIPGCHCDEGAGCRGCGANDFIGLLMLGGFIGALVGLMVVLPASLVVALVINLVAGRRKE